MEGARGRFYPHALLRRFALRSPGPASEQEVVARLPLPAATLPALVRLNPVCLLDQAGSGRGVSRDEPVISTRELRSFPS